MKLSSLRKNVPLRIGMERKTSTSGGSLAERRQAEIAFGKGGSEMAIPLNAIANELQCKLDLLPVQGTCLVRSLTLTRIASCQTG
jgi:hypothetical protein